VEDQIMALAKDSGLPAENLVTRRNLLAAAPAAGIAAMMPGASAIAAVPAGAPLAEQVLHHVAEIERLLQDAAPENVTLTGVQWRTGRNNFWASGHWVNPRNEFDYQLAHFRPQHRANWWLQDKPRIMGTR